jgi:hypothetical protein
MPRSNSFESSGNRAESASVEVKKKPDTRTVSKVVIPEGIGWEDKSDEIAEADLGLVQTGYRESAKGRVKTGSGSSAVVELRKPVPPAARPSERKEYIKPQEAPQRRKALEMPESKVMLGKGLKSLEQQQEEQQAQQKIESLRQQFGAEFNIEKVLQRSNTERALASQAMRAFKERLSAGALTSQDVRRIGLELTSVRDNLEGLQAEARTVAKKEMLVQSMKDNYGVLDEVNKFIYACSLENPKDAAAHLKYETPDQKRKEQKHLVNVEQMKETNPGTVAAQIESKYGYHPEDLRSGNVKGLKGWFAGVKFRMKDRLAHLTGTPSEYDEYRQALNLAPARPEIKLKPGEEYAEVQDNEMELVDTVPAPPSKIIKETRETVGAVKEAMFDMPISIAEAQGLVANADKLWDLANEAITKRPSAKASMLASADENQVQVGGIATNYVLAIAKYMRAKEYPADAKTIARLKKTVDNFSETLGLAGNAQVQASMLHRPDVKNVMRGPVTRQAATKRSEQRWLRP